jgi:hypothetical protein
MKKLALSALVLAFAVSGATTGAEAQSRARAQARPAATGPEAMAKQCQEATKNMYTVDQRVFTYGYCVSRLNYSGNQQAAYGGQPQYYRGPPEQPPYRGQPAQPPYRGPSGY